MSGCIDSLSCPSLIKCQRCCRLFNYLFRRLCNLVFRQVDYNSNGVLDALEVEVPHRNPCCLDAGQCICPVYSPEEAGYTHNLTLANASAWATALRKLATHTAKI